jgi:cytochrome c5
MPKKTKHSKLLFWVIFIIILIFISLASVSLAWASLSGSLSTEAIDDRTKPVWKVDISGAALATEKPVLVVDIGTAVYEKNCKMCHAAGLAGAPKYGNKADWAPRIGKGIAVLHEHVIKGYNAMPARGGCTNCSDDDLLKAVQHMLDAVK